jgi:transcription elongation factor Elf1
MNNNSNHGKIEDEEINNAVQLVNTAIKNYKKDNEFFEFECPACKGQARAILYVHCGSLHGAVECKNCGHIRI